MRQLALFARSLIYSYWKKNQIPSHQQFNLEQSHQKSLPNCLSEFLAATLQTKDKKPGQKINPALLKYTFDNNYD